MRWIAVSTDLLHSQHEWHPHSRGEKACHAFAWIDLISWTGGDSVGFHTNHIERVSIRMLAARWLWLEADVRQFLRDLVAGGHISLGRSVSIGERQGIRSKTRLKVLAAAECAVCGSSERLEVDHVIPVSRGGTNAISNLRSLCKPCNASKGAKLDGEWLQ